MPQTFKGNYQPIPDMYQATTVLGKKFFICLSGRTNGAHLDFVRGLKSVGQTQVLSPEESDYLMVFCPIASRVGTDIGEALDKIHRGKPVILVVMHHTFSPDTVVAPSRRQVENLDVVLTVDCLFYEGNLLKCNRNSIAWNEVLKVLGVPPQVPTSTNSISDMLAEHWPKILICTFILVAIVVTAVVVVLELKQK